MKNFRFDTIDGKIVIKASRINGTMLILQHILGLGYVGCVQSWFFSVGDSMPQDWLDGEVNRYFFRNLHGGL